MASFTCHQCRQLLDGHRIPRLVRDDPASAQHHEVVPNGVGVVWGMRDEDHGDTSVDRRAHVLEDTLGLPYA